jgi:hypothetical protein
MGTQMTKTWIIEQQERDGRWFIRRIVRDLADLNFWLERYRNAGLIVRSREQGV